MPVVWSFSFTAGVTSFSDALMQGGLGFQRACASIREFLSTVYRSSSLTVVPLNPKPKCAPKYRPLAAK